MSTFIGQLVGFAIIVFIVVKWVVPPVRTMMKNQQDAVRAALQESKSAAEHFDATILSRRNALPQATPGRKGGI